MHRSALKSHRQKGCTNTPRQKITVAGRQPLSINGRRVRPSIKPRTSNQINGTVKLST